MLTQYQKDQAKGYTIAIGVGRLIVVCVSGFLVAMIIILATYGALEMLGNFVKAILR